MAFNHRLLKDTLKSRKLTQASLEPLTGKDIRTVRRWLSGQTQPKEKDIRLIAGYLDIEPEKLDPRLEEQSSDKVQLSARVTVSCHNGFQLLKHRYGVSQTEVIELAPVMFAAIADFSKKLVRHNLEEANSAGQKYPINPADLEKYSVEHAFVAAGKLFGEPSDDEHNQMGVDNPFELCLRYLSNGFSDDVSFPASSSLGECPNAVGRVLDEAFVLDFADGDESVAEAVTLGKVRLDLMPAELWGFDRSVDRLAWVKWQPQYKEHQEKKVRGEEFAKRLDELLKSGRRLTGPDGEPSLEFRELLGARTGDRE